MLIQPYVCEFQEFDRQTKSIETRRQDVKAYRFDTKEEAEMFAREYGYEVLKEHDKDEWVVFNNKIEEHWKCQGYEKGSL